MTIKVTSRGSAPTCCFCLDVVGEGIACPACGAGYHEECAAIVGRCVILGCRESLWRGQPVETFPLPRLGSLSRAVGRWARLGLPEGVDLGYAVILLPNRRAAEDPGAARLVAELLGPEHTAYDGRMRIQSPHPEPLGRVDQPQAAQSLLERLRGEGLQAMSMPMQALLAPLDAREVVEVAADPLGLTVVDGEGRSDDVPFGGQRLVVTGSLVGVERKAATRKQGHVEATRHGARYKATTTSLFPQDRRTTEPCLHVFRRDGPPLFFRRNALRSWGPGLRPPPGSIQPWYKLTQDLKQDAALVEVNAAGSASLLAFEPGDTSSQTNRLAAHLVARIWAAAWGSDLLAPPGRAESARPETGRLRLQAPPGTGGSGTAAPGTRSFQVRGLKKP